jgi:hypothetical protein
MKEMATLSVSDRASMGRSGRAKMEQEYDKKNVVAQTVSKILE